MRTSAAPNSVSGARAVQVAAQAKINLRLAILARETSGFHQLETLFLRIDLADVVRVRRTSGARTLDTRSDVDLGRVERNLAWRAAEAYVTASGTQGGFAIELEKRIPVGGGLGGGSADAGAVLRAMDAMAERPLGTQRIQEIAASLGSDVPFLASDLVYALAWGRGERLLALDPPERRAIALLVPEFAIATADAYRWLAESRAATDASAHATGVLDPGALSDWNVLAALAVNDFEPVVGARHPEIGSILAGLRAEGTPFQLAMLSGSGSAMFAVMRSGAHDIQLHRKSRDGPDLQITHLSSATAVGVEPVSAIE